MLIIYIMSQSDYLIAAMNPEYALFKTKENESCCKV